MRAPMTNGPAPSRNAAVAPANTDQAAEAVGYACHDGIAVATINNPPVNALSLAVRQGLMAAIGRAVSDADVKALILIGGGRTFPAGADVKDFGKPYVEPTLYTIMDALCACRKPVVAAIHGTALGGGFELALSCHWRVALADTLIGQPEVKLGLIPGGGGTQWWLRLVGPKAALEITTLGAPITARSASELGAIDAIVDGDLQDGAIRFAGEVLSGKRSLRDASLFSRPAQVEAGLFDEFRARHRRKWKGLLAPWRIVDCLEASCKLTFDEGLALEKSIFQECEHSPQSRALIHVFFAEREAAKLPGAMAQVRPARIGSSAVIGAGTMGSGIAMGLANSGIGVTLVDLSEQALARGLETIRKNYATSVARGSIDQETADRALASIRTGSHESDLADADLIVEAVFEDLEVKRDVFRRLDAVAKPEAILATNTSMLDIDAIAAATSRPASVIGAHFFSPANVMKLLEVVRGAQTSDGAVATVMALARTLGKIPVLAGNSEGFIGNRILAAYGREADFLLEEGATPSQIDRVLQDFGFPMGLFAMRDLAGLDVIWRIRKQMAATRPAGGRTSPIADRICEQGWFGQKSGRGYYRYQGREAFPDPQIDELIEAVSRELGIARQPIDDEEVLQRILCAMVNEGARLLEEGVARRAGDIDVVYVHGYGFPAYRGGPMFWAQQLGLDKVYRAVRGYHDRHGDLWRPSRLLARSAAAGNAWLSADTP